VTDPKQYGKAAKGYFVDPIVDTGKATGELGAQVYLGDVTQYRAMKRFVINVHRYGLKRAMEIENYYSEQRFTKMLQGAEQGFQYAWSGNALQDWWDEFSNDPEKAGTATFNLVMLLSGGQQFVSGRLAKGSAVFTQTEGMAEELAEYRTFQTTLREAVKKVADQLGVNPSQVKIYWGREANKVAIIGRDQNGIIEPGAKVIRGSIDDTWTFNISKGDQKIYQAMKRTLVPDFRYTDVMQSPGFIKNAKQMRTWIIEDLRTIADFGGNPGVANYDMELRSVEMGQKLGLLTPDKH
jgi:hypothetical protein